MNVELRNYAHDSLAQLAKEQGVSFVDYLSSIVVGIALQQSPIRDYTYKNGKAHLQVLSVGGKLVLGVGVIAPPDITLIEGDDNGD